MPAAVVRVSTVSVVSVTNGEGTNVLPWAVSSA